jgi:nucleoside-diphosphate-sugar epimerase
LSTPNAPCAGGQVHHGVSHEEYLAFYLSYPDYFRMLAFPRGPGQYAAGQELAERLARSVNEQNERLVTALRQGMAAGELRAADRTLYVANGLMNKQDTAPLIIVTGKVTRATFD